MDGLTLLGAGTLGLAGIAYAYPKVTAYLSNRNAGTLPHEHVKSLIDYFTVKKCKKGVDASVVVGKLLYEECTEHVDGNEVTPNNLP